MLEVLEEGMASLLKFKRYRTLVKEIESTLDEAYRKAPSDKSVYNKGMEIQAMLFQIKIDTLKAAQVAQSIWNPMRVFYTILFRKPHKVHQSHHQFDKVFHEFIDFSRPHIDKAVDAEITEEEMAEEISAVASSVTQSSALDELIYEVEALKEEAVALLDGANHDASL